MSTATITAEQPVTDELALPNKFIYPEFAGFAGEKLMRRLLKGVVLPRALYTTWETIEEEHAYGNDCFLALSKVSRDTGRSLRTVNRHIATFLARGLLTLRPEDKYFRRADGSFYRKAVVVKDFSGLYALAHEYYEWQRSEDYLPPERENLALIQRDPRQVAKLCRFDKYRRLLSHSCDPFERVTPDRRFTEYDPDASSEEEEQAESAEACVSRPNETISVSKAPSKSASKVSQNESTKNDYTNNQNGDSSDSDHHQKKGGADAKQHTYSQGRASGAQDYTKDKETQENQHEHESATNPVPPSPQNIPPGAGKTRESEENQPDVRRARTAMTAAGVMPGQAARRQAPAEALPPPAKHPLARSFIHEVAGLFGDLNEKGSKTRIERSIETYQLTPDAVLLCLVRAYMVARDTADRKIRYRRPDGASNRMPLFCTMFERFAQALGPGGSSWQYSQEQMLSDIAADDRLGLWLAEHQAELTGDGSEQVRNQAEETAEVDAEIPAAGEEKPMDSTQEPFPAPAPPSVGGWKKRENAYNWAVFLVQQLAEDGQTALGVSLKVVRERYHIVLQDKAGMELTLLSREEVEFVVELGRSRGFSVASVQEKVTRRRASIVVDGAKKIDPGT